MTVTIQIGNSDNKLTQAEWSDFVKLVGDYIERYVEDRAAEIHFFASSAGHDPWQNAAWIVAITDEHEPSLRADISTARRKFRQDSAAWTTGKTSFV
jgi:hypothetical protein